RFGLVCGTSPPGSSDFSPLPRVQGRGSTHPAGSRPQAQLPGVFVLRGQHRVLLRARVGLADVVGDAVLDVVVGLPEGDRVVALAELLAEEVGHGAEVALLALEGELAGPGRGQEAEAGLAQVAHAGQPPGQAVEQELALLQPLGAAVEALGAAVVAAAVAGV